MVEGINVQANQKKTAKAATEAYVRIRQKGDLILERKKPETGKQHRD